MAAAILTVTGDGLETHASDLAILRQYVDELAASGVEYEEQDRRADPVTALLITVTATALSTAASELVKLIIKRLCERSEKTPAPASIRIVINTNNYILPRDRVVVITDIETLTRQ
ncbi:MAG TPA: hypothetical protein VKQ72_07855 [Aggregatilineales bacterium]|nr:hypothetical protein [Aggregatilineales bacterium]